MALILRQSLEKVEFHPKHHPVFDRKSPWYRSPRSVGLLILSVLCFLFLAIPSQVQAEDELSKLKARIKALEAELESRPRDPSAYPIPTSINFCGDTIDLSDVDIRRRFELEVIKIIKNRFQIQLYINRATAAFPVIDEIASELDTCADLKFLAVVESALKPTVKSRAKATGWWQFMPLTAKGFKLKVTEGLDERSDLRASTKAALTYLKRLYQRFGSWPLAMAGYNTGPNRLKRSSTAQNQGKFWDLDLYTEAERYSPRVLAMYHVLTHLKDYDIERELTDGWPQEPLIAYRLKLNKARYSTTKTIKVKQEIKEKKSRKGRKSKKSKTRYKVINKKVTELNDKIKFTPLSLALDLPVRDLRRINPHLNGEYLPLDVSFDLYLPPGHEPFLRKVFERETINEVYQNAAARAPKKVLKKDAPQPLQKKSDLSGEEALIAAIEQLGGPISGTYKVTEGDQLWQIAARSGVELETIKSLNGLGPLSVIKVGQLLNLTVK